MREDEIKQLRTSLKQQEEVGKALGEKLRAEARDHVSWFYCGNYLAIL